MRPTWIVLGLVVGLGVVGYVKLREQAPSPAASPALSRTPDAGAAKPAESPPGAGGAARQTPEPTPVAAEARGPAAPASPEDLKAADLMRQIADRRAAGDAAGADAIEKKLESELPDTAEAARIALERGTRGAAEALRQDRPVAERLPVADRARRDLSRALFLPEMFDAQGSPAEQRRSVVESIARLNVLVMTARPAIPGVTTLHTVAPGESPVQIVHRQRLPYGPNVLLFWNHGGNLDPTRLMAGETLVLPVDALEGRVSLERRLLGLYLGGVLVKEFQVGVGKAETPTPSGVFDVRDKFRNPDWDVPVELWKPGQPRRIRYGDPANELGDAWIPISSPEHPTGYGVHGTVRPETVGTMCSNGCVRLRNPEAVEMIDWVRTARGQGVATKIVIR